MVKLVRRVEKMDAECVFRRSYVPVFEMAVEREAYAKDVAGQINNLIENWCLCRYCFYTLSNDPKSKTENKEWKHWATELNNAIVEIISPSIKSGLSKLPVLKMLAPDENTNRDTVFNNKPRLNNHQEVEAVVRDKFSRERIDFSTDFLAQEFVDEYPNLYAYFIEHDGEDTANPYILETFGFDMVGVTSGNFNSSRSLD